MGRFSVMIRSLLTLLFALVASVSAVAVELHGSSTFTGTLDLSGVSSITGPLPPFSGSTLTLSGALSAGVITGAGPGLHFFDVTGATYRDNGIGVRNSSYTLGSAKTVSSVNTGTETLTATAHGYTNGTPVWISSTGTVPAGLAASTDYYVISSATNTLQLSTTDGGSAVNITSAGSGTITLQSITRGYGTVTFYRHDDPAPGIGAMGVNKYGYGYLRNRLFLGSNPVGPTETTDHPLDLLLFQQEGGALQVHARMLFDGTNHTTHIPGWDTTNATEEPANGLFVAENGRVAVGTITPAANAAMTISGVLHLVPQSTPGTPTEGDVYAGTDHHLYFYNGTTWKQLDN